jgi:hypothetical protein
MMQNYLNKIIFLSFQYFFTNFTTNFRGTTNVFDRFSIKPFTSFFSCVWCFGFIVFHIYIINTIILINNKILWNLKIF